MSTSLLSRPPLPDVHPRSGSSTPADATALPVPADASVGSSRERLLTLSLFTALSLTCYLDRFIMGALVTPVKAEFNLSDEQVGRIEAAFNLAYVVGIPLFGFLGDRVSRKVLLMVALVVWSAASIGSGFATGLGVLLLWRALVGFGEGGFNSISPTWLADVFPARSRALAFSVFNSVSKVGATLGVALGGYLAARYSWHVAFWVAGVPGLILAFGLLRAKEPVRGASDGHSIAPTQPTWRESLRIFARPDYVLHVVGYTFYTIALSTLFFWGPAYFHRVFDLPNVAATGFFGLGYTVAGLPGVYAGGFVAGWLLRRIRAAYAVCLSAAMVLVTPVLVAAFLVENATAFRGLIWTEMFLLGSCSAVITALLMETVSVSQRAVALASALVIASGIGGVTASQVVGLLSDQYGLHRAIFVAPIAAGVAAVAWTAIAVRQSRRSAPPAHSAAAV